MSQAYATAYPKRARQLPNHRARSLEREYFGATASLRKGLEETLAIIMRLDLPDSRARVVSSINPIETLFSRVRDMARRVPRWQGGAMILRWTAPASSRRSATSAKSPARPSMPHSRRRANSFIRSYRLLPLNWPLFIRPSRLRDLLYLKPAGPAGSRPLAFTPENISCFRGS